MIQHPKKTNSEGKRVDIIEMAEFICPDCGKKMYHENQTTLEIEKGVHKKFCSKKPGDTQSYMHRT